tara:strand:- start:353 stop:595 length:243 start_codon:yes stop_codon:yes gene_type:complete
MSVAEAVYIETCKVCEAVSKWFQRGLIQFQRGKQLSANRAVMEQMKYEFTPKGDHYMYLQKLNDQTNLEYDKKLEELEKK